MKLSDLAKSYVNKKIAIIYSVDELFCYIVEIRKNNESYLVGSEINPEKFGNLEEARRACIKHKAEKGFLALSKTYEEVDASSDNAPFLSDRYDYIPVSLK